MPGMSFTRNVTLKGGETKKYADANAFIKGTCKTFTPPESIATFEDEEKGGVAYVQEDGTVSLYSGYTEFATGTYYKTADDFGIIIEGEEVEVNKEGNKASFTYTYSMGGGYDVEYTYVCDDISVLPEKAKDPAGGEEETGEVYTATMKESLGVYEADVTYTLTLIDATNYKITAVASQMSLATMTGTYTKDGNTVTLVAGNTGDSTMPSLVKGKLNWTLGNDGTMTPVAAAE